MRKLISTLFKRSPKLFFLISLQSIFSAVATYMPLIILPYFLKNLIDKDFKNTIFWLLVFLISKALLIPLNQLFSSIVSKQSIKFNNRIIQKLFDKAMSLPYTKLQKGDTRGKIQHAHDILFYDFDYEDAIIMLNSIIKNIIFVITSLWVIQIFKQFYFIIILALPLIIGIPILLYLHKKHKKKLYKLIEGHGKVERDLGYLLNEIIYNFKIYLSFHIFNLFDMITNKLQENSDETADYFMTTRKLNSRNNILLSILTTISTATAFAVVIYQVKTGIIQVQYVLTYIQAITLLYSSIFDIQDLIQSLTRNIPYLDKIEEILNWETEIKDQSEEEITSNAEQLLEKGISWEVKNLSYKYEGSEKYALKNINLELNDKSINALVGKNGSGKTTLVLLLSGLLKPTEGTISFNGTNLNDIDPQVYRKILSIIFQESYTLPLNLMENIYFDHAEEKIQNNETYESKYGIIDDFKEDVQKEKILTRRNLSGGEIQKILITRALNRETPALIMDEPNSALDVHAEEKLYASLLEKANNKFVLFVTHRMRSCKDCNNIFVMDNGNLIARGTHSELVEKCPVYSELWNAQVDLYR